MKTINKLPQVYRILASKLHSSEVQNLIGSELQSHLVRNSQMLKSSEPSVFSNTKLQHNSKLLLNLQSTHLKNNLYLKSSSYELSDVKKFVILYKKIEISLPHQSKPLITNNWHSSSQTAN